MVAHTRVGKSMDEWVGRGFVKLRNRVFFFICFKALDFLAVLFIHRGLEYKIYEVFNLW